MGTERREEGLTGSEDFLPARAVSEEGLTGSEDFLPARAASFRSFLSGLPWKLCDLSKQRFNS